MAFLPSSSRRAHPQKISEPILVGLTKRNPLNNLSKQKQSESNTIESKYHRYDPLLALEYF